MQCFILVITILVPLKSFPNCYMCPHQCLKGLSTGETSRHRLNTTMLNFLCCPSDNYDRFLRLSKKSTKLPCCSRIFDIITWVIFPSLHEVYIWSSDASTILLIKFSETRTEEGGRQMDTGIALPFPPCICDSAMDWRRFFAASPTISAIIGLLNLSWEIPLYHILMQLVLNENISTPAKKEKRKKLIKWKYYKQKKRRGKAR